MKKQIIIFIIALVVVAAGSFFLGTTYAKNNVKNNFSRSMQGGMLNEGYGFNRTSSNSKGSSMIDGEVLSKDDTSITVKSKDGGSKIILFSDSTTVLKSTEGAISDLNDGDEVIISGKTNDDGSVTAESIQIRDQLMQQQNQGSEMPNIQQ